MVAQSLPPELSHVVELVDSSPESLARGDMGMHTAALAAAQLIYKICKFAPFISFSFHSMANMIHL
jgi:hypothetical protein